MRNTCSLEETNPYLPNLTTNQSWVLNAFNLRQRTKITLENNQNGQKVRYILLEALNYFCFPPDAAKKAKSHANTNLLLKRSITRASLSGVYRGVGMQWQVCFPTLRRYCSLLKVLIDFKKPVVLDESSCTWPFSLTKTEKIWQNCPLCDVCHFLYSSQQSCFR